jgi:hypothetical protein
VSEDRRYHRRLPCCNTKPKVEIEGNTTTCKCGFTYRAVYQGIWINFERVTPAVVGQLNIFGGETS